MTAIDREYTGKDTLEFLKDAVNYNRFLEQELLGFLAPFDHALDFGAGNGEFAARLQAHGKHIIGVEADPELRSILTARGITTVADIESAPLQQRIYSQNVLEHIEDDEDMLRAFHKKLQDNGALFLYVPAFNCLYSPLDKALGHYRRYRKKELVQKLENNGFAVERAEYVDALGFLCWLVMGKLPGSKTSINPLLVKCFDRLLFPLSRIIDKGTKNYFGKNLLLIAKRK